MGISKHDSLLAAIAVCATYVPTHVVNEIQVSYCMVVSVIPQFRAKPMPR